MNEFILGAVSIIGLFALGFFAWDSIVSRIKREIHEMEMNQDREIQDRIDQVYRFIDEETRPLRDNIDKLYDKCNK
jgi:predicted phage-related endonuclease